MHAWKKLWLTVTVAPIALLGCSSTPEGTRPVVMLGELLTPGGAAGAYERGKQHFVESQFGLAMRDFQTALVIDPASVNTLNALGATYDRLGRYDLAERSYRQALAIDPQSAQTLNNIGYSYVLQGKYDLAAVFLRDARAADQADALVERNLEMAEAGLATGASASREAAAVDELTAFDNLAAAPAEADMPPRPRIERTTSATQRLVTGLAPADPASAPDGPAPIRAASRAPRAQVGEPPAGYAAGQVAGFATPRPATNDDYLLTTQQRTPPADRPQAEIAAAADAPRPATPLAGRRLISAPTQRTEPEAAPGEVAALVPDAERLDPVAPPSEVAALAPDAARSEPLASRTEVAALTPAARTEPVAPPSVAASSLRGPMIEVSNGAGRLRMAARMRDHLAAQGIRSSRLTNADNFRHQTSTVFYRPGWEEQAQAFVAQLPIVAALVAREKQFADLRLELGGDLLDFDRELILAARKAFKNPAG